MKQFQIMFVKETALSTWLNQIRKYAAGHSIRPDSMLFRIYSDSVSPDSIRTVITTLTAAFPGCSYAGTTTAGNIIHGSLASSHIAVTCTLFEDPETKIRILQLPMDHEAQDTSAAAISDAVRAFPWVKAIEIMTTLNSMDASRFCRSLSGIDESIAIFGGGTNTADFITGDTRDTFVFSSAGDLARYHAVFLLQGGPSFCVSTQYMTGWRRLGSPFTVTASEGSLLLELDHRPAFEIYEKFLDIPADEHFFRIANAFPLSLEADNTSYLRIVTSYTENNALQLAGPVSDGLPCYISFANPSNIMDDLSRSLKKLNDFSPQIIQLYSCAARRYFWGSGAVSQETLPFEGIAPASGFYTSGEFLRSNREVLLHNCTLVIAGFREGEGAMPKQEISTHDAELSYQMMISNCLVSFINAQNDELKRHP